jgi:hypothetical protein
MTLKVMLSVYHIWVLEIMIVKWQLSAMKIISSKIAIDEGRECCDFAKFNRCCGRYRPHPKKNTSSILHIMIM